MSSSGNPAEAFTMYSPNMEIPPERWQLPELVSGGREISYQPRGVTDRRPHNNLQVRQDGLAVYSGKDVLYTADDISETARQYIGEFACPFTVIPGTMNTAVYYEKPDPDKDEKSFVQILDPKFQEVCRFDAPDIQQDGQPLEIRALADGRFALASFGKRYIQGGKPTSTYFKVGNISVVDPEGKRETITFPGGSVYEMAIVGDHLIVSMTQSEALKVSIYNITDKQQRSVRPFGDNVPVQMVVDDKKNIFYLGRDGQIYQLDPAKSGTMLSDISTTITPPEVKVRSFACGPSGLLIAGQSDGTLLLINPYAKENPAILKKGEIKDTPDRLLEEIGTNPNDPTKIIIVSRDPTSHLDPRQQKYYLSTAQLKGRS